MKRILIFGMHDKIGGVETFLMNYYKNICKDSIQFDFVNMYDKLCFQDDILAMGGKVHKVINVKKNPFKYYTQLKKVIHENGYDTVHINMLSMANIIPVIVAKRLKIKNIIIHSHNTSTPHGVIRKIMDRLNKKIAIKSATHLVACSKLAGEWMFGSENDFCVINNAIDLDKYRCNWQIRNKIREELNIQDKFVIGNIARFSEQKNHEFLIDVFNEISLIEPSAVLLLIGEGELKEKIKEKVNKYGLMKKVLFLDPVSNANDYYQAMDVFVLPSLFEGLPVVGIEAQASGTNCVFSDTITRELELTHFTKFIGLNENKEKWAKEILELKNKGKMNIENTKLIERYDIGKETENLLKIYNDDVKYKKKIMHMVYGLGNGGVENVLYNYFSRMNKDDEYQLIIVTQDKPRKEVKDKFENIGFKIYELPEKKKNMLKYIKRMREILRKEKPDIIHCHMTMGNFLPNAIAFFSGIKIRISHSHFAYAETNIKTFIYRKIGKIFSNRYMACTKDAAQYLFGKNIKKVFILKNAIDIEKFQFNKDIRNEVRKSLNLTDKYVIGNVGRFTEQKNHEFLIDVFYEIQKTKENALLLLIGEGELKDKIQDKIKILKIEDKVIILENSQNVNELMMAMDVFLFPTLFEGLGIVLIEAQATGLRCISSDRVPKEEVRIANNIEFLSLSDDKKIWSSRVLEDNNKQRDSIEKDKFEKRGYSIENEINKLKEYYEKI